MGASATFLRFQLDSIWYNEGMSETSERTRQEIGSILEIVQELTGLSSHWSGRVELVPNAQYKGRKPFSCDILIAETLAHQDIRWSTLLHETLHSVSVGYIAADYRAFRGWEEGVVEQLQRLLRSTVLARLEVSVDETLFQSIDATHQYNVYIGPLERLRILLNLPERTFYMDLLRTPIKARPGYVFEIGNQLLAQARIPFIRELSTANAVLKSGLPSSIIPEEQENNHGSS